MIFRLITPWTPEQVKALTEYQTGQYGHPYTCGAENCRADLIATTRGWICQFCDYTQNWAHEGHVDEIMEMTKPCPFCGVMGRHIHS